MAMPYTVIIQFIVSFSQKTLQYPSLFASRNVVAAVFNPAPFFCVSTPVTTYLNGLLSVCRPFKHASTTVLVQSFTFFRLYMASFSVVSIAFLTMFSHVLHAEVHVVGELGHGGA